MSVYNKIVTYIQVMRQSDPQPFDADKVIAYAASLGVEVRLSIRKEGRRGFFIGASLSYGNKGLGSDFTESETRLDEKSFLLYKENRIINNTIVDTIEEAARKRRES